MISCNSSATRHALVMLLLVCWTTPPPVVSIGSDQDISVPTATLADGSTFPLVGLGVGNLQHELIAENIESAMASDKQTWVFDTAHASKNEHLVKAGIVNGFAGYKTRSGSSKQVHVITKVWYTHLGYERTKLSVKESLEALNHPNIKVHMLLHWPRCDDSIPWMHCEQEEKELPPEVQKAGPPPYLDKDTAFLESWRALEDIYLGKVTLGRGLPKLASIGVSNFNLEELQAIESRENHRVTPMILQVS
jgi:diketogulonate reductase-like aldo/keto reductase